jgi:hypothetical protein
MRDSSAWVVLLSGIARVVLRVPLSSQRFITSIRESDSGFEVAGGYRVKSCLGLSKSGQASSSRFVKSNGPPADNPLLAIHREVFLVDAF